MYYAMQVQDPATRVNSRNGGTLDSREFMRRFRKGEPSAFAELIDSLTPKLRSVARAITRNPDDAEDVIQNAIVQALARLRQLRSDDKFPSWLMRITVNEARRYRRLAFNRLSSPLDAARGTKLVDSHCLPIEHLVRDESRRAVRRALRQVDPKFRQVLLMYYWRQTAVPEMSRVLGLSENNIKTRLCRARKQVLRALKRRGLAGTLAFE